MNTHTDDVIIACAPNGARRGKADHAGLPITPDELAQTAREIRDAGACLLHMHVRDDAGGHSLDAGRYRDAIAAVKSAVGDSLIIQITTEAVGVYDVEAQMAAVRAVRPEAVSCALREFCPDDASVPAYANFLAECRDMGAWVQHILYDDIDVARFLRFWRAGIIGEPRPFVLLVLGRYGAQAQSDPRDLASRIAPFLADAAPRWAVCAFGESELRLTVAAAAMGGHIRVGFENNLHEPGGALAASNAAQIARCVAALAPLGLAPATAADVRAHFTLPR